MSTKGRPECECLPLGGTARSALAAALLLVVTASLSGCAYNIDRTGESRVGIFLWGFGDPPGVNWHLDWPRRELPEFPPTTYPELPPARPPSWSRTPVGDPAHEPPREAQPAASIEDNRDCGNASFPSAGACCATSDTSPDRPSHR